MNAYACFPDLPSPVQRYIRTLEADKEALEADRAALEARAAVAARRIAELSERVRYLEEQFRLAQLKRYAPRSEKSRERVFNEAEHEAKADPGTDERTVPLLDTGLPQEAPRSPEPPRGRRALPAELPRQRIEYDLPDAQKCCPHCQRMMHRIGEDISEQLHIPPRQVWVWQHVRFKYGCRHCERHEIRAPVVRAEMPAQPLPGSVASAATIATVMTSKYADGLPLYRMEQVFHRAGIQIGRGTMGHWLIGASQRHLQRLYDAMHHVLLTQPLIHGDETTLQVLHEAGRHAQSKSYMWAYRSAEPSAEPVVLFDYQLSRAQHHPQAFLNGYTGKLISDGYLAWRSLQGVTHFGCWAHARRRFDEALKASPQKDGRAEQALTFIRRLYKVEALARDRQGHPELLYRWRQQHSAPVLTAFKAWLDEQAQHVLPKSLLGKAIGYTREQWIYLSRYAEDGHAPIDNNLIERDIRPFCTGRKNWLFSDTAAGARASAVIYSLMLTCRACQVKPWDYLNEVLTELPKRPDDAEVNDLLPWHFAQRQPVTKKPPSG
ncbi:IS66 family transposase [Candidatus Glomeribacter gigasporarum]|uniref:IS66 family transposase n=1 Tax=Candidatus Glomeribacter gigasporarum TaxID=132144 RepID=UPI00030A5F4B|nr:IS66 family transposase [Candidatus Glomeribacter gigasporarum]